MTFWGKVKYKMRYGLTLRSILLNLKKIGIEIIPYYLFQESKKYASLPDCYGDPSEYSLELFGTDRINILGTLIKGFNLKESIEYLESGDLCLVLKYRSEIAAFTWTSFNEIRYCATHIKIKNNEGWLSAMYTVDSFRGRNLAPFLRYKSYELLNEMGRDVFYSVSEYFNTPAVKFKEKLNAKKLKLILFIRLFKKMRISFTLKSNVNTDP
jgi:hypothetical protein